jgi:hypothetical protein
MIPLEEAGRRVRRFVLVPDLFACCFGQPPQIQHTALVECPEGVSVGYYPDEIEVVGTLRVEVMREEGFIVNVFQLTPKSVRPIPR